MLRAHASDLAFEIRERATRWLGIIPGSRRANRFGAFGAGSIVCFPPREIFGEQSIAIGSGTAVGPACSLTVGMVPGQELLATEMLVIGDRCVIGRNCSIAAHLQIVIEDDVYFGPNVFVTDQNHANTEPGVAIGRQIQPERPVRIGARSWLGTNVVVTPGVTIGSDVIVGANSVVTNDLLDGTVAGGIPARPLDIR